MLLYNHAFDEFVSNGRLIARFRGVTFLKEPPDFVGKVSDYFRAGMFVVKGGSNDCFRSDENMSMGKLFKKSQGLISSAQFMDKVSVSFEADKVSISSFGNGNCAIHF